MKHIFVQVGSQNAIVINTNKFENNSMNSLWPFYVAVTEPVVIATSSFLSTVSRNTAAVFFVPQERHKCLISGLINIFKFWLKYFYCTIILLLFLLQVYNICFLLFIFHFSAAPYSLQDLSSLPRDQIHALSSESAEF